MTFTDAGRGVFKAEGLLRCTKPWSRDYGPLSASPAGLRAAEKLPPGAWAWAHFDLLEKISHPVPYLFRVGRSRTRLRRLRLIGPSTSDWSEPWVEPGLARALATLTQRQRVAVMLICGHE